MNVLCKIFGHKFKSGWAGERGGPFGAVVVNLKTCDRCDHCEKEFSTVVEFDLPQAIVTNESA